MKTTRFTTILSALVALTLLSPAVPFAATEDQAQSPWQEVFNLLQGGEDASQPQMLQEGEAMVNMTTGLIRFEVDHLPVLVGPSDLRFGTQEPASTMVKGTLVCHVSAGAKATLVDTPSIPVTDDGNAAFSGYVQLPQACRNAPHDIAFFVRTTDGGTQEL